MYALTTTLYPSIAHSRSFLFYLDSNCIDALVIDITPIPHEDCDAPDQLITAVIDKVCNVLYA